MKIIKNQFEIIFPILLLFSFFIFFSNSPIVDASTAVIEIDTNSNQLLPSDISEDNFTINSFSKPQLERLGGGGLSLKMMSPVQATSFSNSMGYYGRNAVHDFKTDYLKGITTKIAHFNLEYSTKTRQVFLVNRNRYGIDTGGYYKMQ